MTNPFALMEELPFLPNELLWHFERKVHWNTRIFIEGNYLFKHLHSIQYTFQTLTGTIPSTLWFCAKKVSQCDRCLKYKVPKKFDYNWKYVSRLQMPSIKLQGNKHLCFSNGTERVHATLELCNFICFFSSLSLFHPMKRSTVVLNRRKHNCFNCIY